MLEDVSLDASFPAAVVAMGDGWHARRLRWTWHESLFLPS
jgi:hypothetical protein